MAIRKFIRRHPLLRHVLGVPRALRRFWKGWRQAPVIEVLERIGSVIKGPVVFEVKEFDGTFSINPRSHLLRRVLHEGFYEPRISSLFIANIDPDRDIVDVGANIGFFTVAGAKRLKGGRLLAVEPTSEAFDQLSKNVVRNGVSERVILFKGMIGASSGNTTIRSVPGLEEYSSSQAIEHFAAKEMEIVTEVVPVETVDILVQRHNLHPAIMKVDVEGAEYSVFAGARQTLSNHRPIVISEIWRESESGNGTDLVKFLKDLDYIVLDPHDPRSPPGLHEIGEIFCVPKERYSVAMVQ